MCVNAPDTFKGEQCPLQRAQRSGLVSGEDLLEEAVCVVAPQRAGKAVDARCQLETDTNNRPITRRYSLLNLENRSIASVHSCIFIKKTSSSVN